MRKYRVLVAILVAVTIISGSLLIYVALEVSGRPPWHGSFDWSFERKLRDEGFAAHGGIAIEESVIHVAYVDYPVDESELMGVEYTEVLYERSSDVGKTWSPPTRLSVNPRIFGLDPLIVAAHESYVLTLWYEGRYVQNPFGGAGFLRDLAMVISRDEGDSWTEPVIVNQHGTTYLDRAAVSISCEMIAVIYTDFVERPGTYLRVSTDGGHAWSNESLLPLEGFGVPMLYVFNDTLYMAVGDYEGTGVSHLLWSHDKGETWNSTEIVSFKGYDCGLGNLLVEGNHAHTVCEGVGYSRSPLLSWNWTSPNPQAKGWMLLGNSERLYSINPESDLSTGSSVILQESEDFGDTWSDEVILIQGSYPDIFMFSVAADSDTIGIVWTSQTDGFDTREVHFTLFSSDDYSLIDEGALTNHTTELLTILFYSSLFTLASSSCALVAVVFYVRRARSKDEGYKPSP